MSIYNKRLFSITKVISDEELKNKFGCKEFEYLSIILLFGSRAKGDFHIKSDYDFAFLTKNDISEPWGIKSKVWNDIGDILKLPDYDYDIVDLNDANKNIINSIKNNYILLKGDENELQRLFNSYN